MLDAFFNADDLASWWHASRSLSSASVRQLCRRVADRRREGRGAGTDGWRARGTVIEFKPGREFFVADAYWLPPDGDPIGPMAFEASCTTLGERVVLRVRQSGGENTRRWARYYEVLTPNLIDSLNGLERLPGVGRRLPDPTRWSFRKLMVPARGLASRSPDDDRVAGKHAACDEFLTVEPQPRQCRQPDRPQLTARPTATSACAQPDPDRSPPRWAPAAQRRQHPRRLAAARHGNDRRRSCMLRQRHRRITDRLPMRGQGVQVL